MLIVLFLLCFFASIIVDTNSVFIILFAYIIGSFVTKRLNRRDDNKSAVYLYQIVFLVYSAYSILCYAYMNSHNYSYLIEPDIIDSFVPITDKFTLIGNVFESWNAIWGNFNFFNDGTEGFFTYSIIWGHLSYALSTNLYFTLQISSVFLSSFVVVIIYRLLIVNSFSNKESVKYSLIISFCSHMMMYGSIALRDIHIMLLYLLAIFLTFKSSFTFGTLIRLIIVIFICCTFRIESGLFLSLLIPTYLLLTLQKPKQKNVVLISATIFILVFIFIFAFNFNNVEMVFNYNQEHYADKVMEGSGMIAFLQKIPILGNILSIIYTLIQPLPFYAKMVYVSMNRYETYNIMRFPQAIAPFLSFFSITCIMFWLLSKQIRLSTRRFMSKTIKYQLWIAFLFLFIQSAIVEQRRLLGYYVILYIFAFIIYSHLNENDKKNIKIVSIIIFFTLQIIGAIYLL